MCMDMDMKAGKLFLDWSGMIGADPLSLGFKQFEHIKNRHFFVGESVYPSINRDSGESVNTILLYQPTVAPTYSFPDPF